MDIVMQHAVEFNCHPCFDLLRAEFDRLEAEDKPESLARREEIAAALTQESM